MSEGSKRALHLASALLVCLPVIALGQNPPPKKNLPAGPPAPQSTHYPILILAFGNAPDWSLRIGQKGPERLDRHGYPPIPLEPSDVTHEAADSWTYHAKDSATSAAVAVHLTREACTDAASDTLTPTPPPSGKYAFRASVDHAQIGSLIGCARIAAELFPKINNQPDPEKEEDDAKKKPPVPVSTVTKFKSPVAVAYLNASQQLVFKRGQVSRVVSPRPSSGLSVSHDGKRLLFTADEEPGPIRSLYQFDFDTSARHELLRANVRQAFWSPDDKRIALLKWDNSAWSAWIMSPDNPQAGTSILTRDILELFGWADDHTLLVSDLGSLLWISDDGSTRQQLPIPEVFGSAYRLPRIDSVLPNPVNPDILLVSFWYVPPAGEVPLNKHEGNSPALLLYEIKSKRRIALTPVGTWAESAEWSRDGFQIFFTGADSSRRYATYRLFWDGIGLQKYLTGTSLVIGQ